MIVSWVSADPKAPSKVKYGHAKTKALTSEAEGTSSSYSFEGYTSGGLHHVLLTGLKPATRYFYQVGGNNDWSKIFNFTTAPLPGTQNIIFAFIGDVGADPDSIRTIDGIIRSREESGLDVVVHAGDLSYANNYFPGGPVWDKFGEILEPLAAFTPYNPAVGNHESIDDFTGFKLRYAMDSLQKHSGGGYFYYSFDYGNVHTIILSSETDFHVGSQQHKWLVQDLKSIDRSLTPWVVASWHTPWYNSNKAHHKEGQKMRKIYEPLFHQYKVDLAVVGHVHAYERTFPVYDYHVTPGATVYVTAGNGGSPEGVASGWHHSPEWSAFRYSEWGHSRIHFYNATHAHWTQRSNSGYQLRDEYWFIKEQ